MFTSPFPLATDLHALLTRAAALAADRAHSPSARRDAAEICRTLATVVPSDEALCSAMMGAAGACGDTPRAVLDLLSAARATAPDDSRLVQPILRLCRAAHEAGQRATVVVALWRLARIDAFDGEAPVEWLRGASDLEREAAFWMRQLLVEWIGRFGGNNDGVLSIVRDRQDEWFLMRHRFRNADLIRIHVTQPTAAGWIALARRRHELAKDPLPLSFGARHGDAVTTLEEALARSHDPATHVALERWLSELAQ